MFRLCLFAQIRHWPEWKIATEVQRIYSLCFLLVCPSISIYLWPNPVHPIRSSSNTAFHVKCSLRFLHSPPHSPPPSTHLLPRILPVLLHLFHIPVYPFYYHYLYLLLYAVSNVTRITWLPHLCMTVALRTAPIIY